MVVNCEEVWREVSNYLDGEVEPGLRAAMEEHVRGCRQCAAVLDGTRNVIQLYGDERMLEVPLGFSRRLERRLEANMSVLVSGAFEVARSFGSNQPDLRSEQAQRAVGIPQDMMVVVAEDGKTFHVAGCTFIHDKARLQTIPAREAMREGYAPCVRCMKKYLTAAAIRPAADANEDLASFKSPLPR